MVKFSKNKNLFVLISFICIIGFVSSSFAASIGVPQMIPDGKIHVYDGNQKIAEVTAESPLPQGKMLKIEGTCGIKLDSLYLVATDKSALIVKTEKRGQELLVKDGKVFFGITAITNPITFFTPQGGVVAQQVMLKASSQSSILEGYIDVSEKEAEIGVISGGSMIITTADGEVSIDTGERFLFAQAQIPATAAAATTTAPAASELSGGTIAAIVGGVIAVPIIWSAFASGDNVSKKSP